MASVVFDEATVKLRPAIAEKAHAGAMQARLIEVETGDKRSRFTVIKIADDIAPFIGDETCAVETLGRAAMFIFAANAIGCDNGHAI